MRVQLLKGAGTSARVEDGAFIFRLLEAVKITSETKDEVIALIEAVVSFLTQVRRVYVSLYLDRHLAYLTTTL